jgi:hypothetical protein
VRGYLHAATGRRLRGVLAAALVAVAVTVPPASGALHPVVFGSTFTISGVVPSAKRGEAVQILARAYGQRTFGRVGAVTTAAGGSWTFKSRPRIGTTYLAVWRGNMTATLAAAVAPRLDLALYRGLLSVTARTANPLRGHSLVVQLRERGTQWHNVRVVVLGPASSATVPFTAPHGRSEIRLFMSKSQAGAGYIAGVSGVLVYPKAARRSPRHSPSFP